MPSRDTFNMALLPIPQVVFPGIISQVIVRPKSLGGSARTAMAQDHGLILSWTRADHEPSTIATSARILNIEETSDALHVTVAGIQRTHILSYRHQGSALVGQFRYASDSEENIPAMLIEEAWALGSELWGMVNHDRSHPFLPQTAPLLSYWIAAHIPLNAPTQQELLEIANVRGRLAREISLMRTLLDGMRAEHSG